MSHLPLDLSAFTTVETGCVLTILDENSKQEYLFHLETTTVTELPSGRVQIHDTDGSYISLYPSQMVNLGLTVAGLTGSVTACQGTDTLDTQIIVTQANYLTTIGSGSIDSTKEYFLDGVIDMGSTSIEIPAGGIYISGYNFNLSGLTSTALGYTMFTSPVGGSGDVLFMDFHIDVTGVGSQVYDIVGNTGFEAIEVDRINYNNCSSLGEINTYRQGLETGTGRFGGTPELTLGGVWVGGYFIDTSIVRSLVDGAYFLYKAGVGFVMSSRFRSNQNIDLNATVGFFDFAPVNFANDNILQLDGCIVTRNGATATGDGTITPNISQTDIASKWGENIGLPNTFVGGQLAISTEVTTVITTDGVFEDLLGTYTPTDLQHFDSPLNGQLRHLGGSPREYRVFVTGVFDSTANNEVDLKIVVWDNSASIFVDYKLVRRVVNSLQGGRDVAFFTLIDNVILDENDYVKLQVANIGATNNITAELDTELIIEAR